MRRLPESRTQFQIEVEQALGDGDSRQLTEDRDPSQDDQGPEAHPVGAVFTRVICVLCRDGAHLHWLIQTDYL